MQSVALNSVTRSCTVSMYVDSVSDIFTAVDASSTVTKSAERSFLTAAVFTALLFPLRVVSKGVSKRAAACDRKLEVIHSDNERVWT